MRARLKTLLAEMMLIPGLSGYEGRVRKYLKAEMQKLGLATSTDGLGNLIATADGDPGAPSVMLFTHMDQLGFVVRKIEPTGLIRVERLGGVPERALASQAVLLCIGEGRDVPGLIANKVGARFSLGAQNVFVLTNYSGLDPEIYSGIDNTIYPRARSILLGVNLSY